MGLNREETLEKVVREDKNLGRVRYTITYDPKLPHLPAILGRNWRVMVETDPRLTRAFSKPPMVCLRRGKNLKKELVRARLPPNLGRQNTRAAQGPRAGFTSWGNLLQYILSHLLDIFIENGYWDYNVT